jgi:hypothetical protein
MSSVCAAMALLIASELADGQARPNLRITHVEFAEDRRQHELGNRRARPDQQAAAHLPGHFGDADIEFARQPEDALGVVEHQFAGRRQRDSPATAVEKARIEALFELFDLKGHGRLGHVQRLAGLGKGKVPGHSMKHLQSTISHKSLPLFDLARFNHKTARRPVDKEPWRLPGTTRGPPRACGKPGANKLPAFMV